VGGSALELVLSLDNTASMNSGGRLPALQSAAKSMVDTVLDGAAASGAYAKIGIVPFSNYVNVGMANRTASWINVADDYSNTSYSCYNTYPSATYTNCHPVTYTAYNDGVPYDVTTDSCDYDPGPPTEVCGNYTSNYAWHGCVGSRSSPNDREISGSENYTGLLKNTYGYEVWCAAEITPLTSDKSVLNTQIDAMTGVGNTYIAPGVLWGWHMLDAAQPIVGAKSKTWMNDNGGSKVLVLMTDGENTLSVGGSDTTLHDGSDLTGANTVTAATCENAKADGITIYTVALMVTNAAALDVLKNCASDPSKVFTADDPSALTAAFQDIANSLVATRLTK
jgi:hypothetical protein